MQAHFHSIAAHLEGQLRGEEVLTSSFHGEDSDFVRFNHGKLRQAGSVTQGHLVLDLILGARHAAAATTLSGVMDEDRARVEALLRDLRAKLPHLPEDPYLHVARDLPSSETRSENRLPDAVQTVDRVRAAARDRDLVGLYAAGSIFSGFASSLGQRHWHETHNFNLDWSFYHRQDKAVKAGFAGFQWDDQAFERRVATALQQLEALALPARRVEPGRYRVYLAPAAVHDVAGMLAWGGYGLKSQRTKQTPLLRMLEGEASLSPAVSIHENTAEGVAPPFEGAGFGRPDRVPLIEGGRLADSLVSPRSAKEYGVPTNGASEEESPESMDMAAGDLPEADVLGRLERGVYVGNLHYLNFSDRSACRTTGMTRFATFWVDGGEIQAPLEVMRFDETVYRVLGENLSALTTEREFILDPSSYDRRSTESARLPGALVEEFTFTL